MTMTPTPERVFEPVIDQHDTWLAVNPVQGCPKHCRYCYLKDLGQVRVKPAVLATPEETLQQLLAHRYYHPSLTLALYTCTDALATPVTRDHLIRTLDLLGEHHLPNPVCLITKCAVPDNVIETINRNRAQGLKVLIYLSYSGLGPDIEQGIDHDALRGNFPRLHSAGIPVIHYWRPALPHNSTLEAITTVMDWAFQYALATVAVGTKVKPSAREQITDLWPQLADPALNPLAADSVWPRATWHWLHHIPDRYRDHPIFQTNSCALAYALQRADRANVLNTPTCREANRCPARQRALCRASAPPEVTEGHLTERLAAIGHPDVPFTWQPRTRTVVLGHPLELRDQHNLAQVLAVTVRAPGTPGERYWQGRLAGGQPLVIDPTDD